MNSDHLLHYLKAKTCRRGGDDAGAGDLRFLERGRESTFSIGFRPIGPSVLEGARSKVALRSEGNA